MNRLQGVIKEVITEGALSIVRIESKDTIFSSIVIDTPQTNTDLQVGRNISVIFKESEVIIGKGDVTSISLRNKLKGTILKIDMGHLLSRLSIKTSAGIISSVITTNAVENLNLSIKDEVWAMIKTNEVMISK